MPSVTVLFNPAAGGVRMQGPEGEIATLFAAAGCQADVKVLRQGHDPADAARAASAAGSIVVAAGGDGTVSRVAAGVFEADGTLGVLPLGTLNHFAKDLHIPLALGEAVQIVAARRVGPRDVGQGDQRPVAHNFPIRI